MKKKMNEIRAVVHIPHIRVENANATTGPITWGFPSPTAFTGFTHALERRLGDVLLGGVGIVCHRFEPHVSFSKSFGRFGFGRLHLARPPCIAGWKSFKDSASTIVEEGRTHMEVSLVITVHEWDEQDGDDLARRVSDAVSAMRLAGGAIFGHARVCVLDYTGDDDTRQDVFRTLRHRLLPGFTLVRRDKLIAERLAILRRRDPDPEATALDAFLDCLALHVTPRDEANEVAWRSESITSGWLTPMPLGYAALSPTYAPGEVANARDNQTPFRFVESLYGICEWIGPHRIGRLEQMLWFADADPERGVYSCRNDYESSIAGEIDE